ncbi:hypothetical protein JOD24_000569 [Kroppenstedtia sanguinis]
MEGEVDQTEGMGSSRRLQESMEGPFLQVEES